MREVHGLSQLWPHRSSRLSSNELIFQSEGVSVAAEKLIDEVGTTLLSTMVVDQEPKKVKTSSLIMVLNRLSPRSLRNNRGQDDVEFKVPFEAITGEKAKDTQFVDFLVSFTRGYQVTRSNADTKYSWRPSTIRIKVREIASLHENFRIQYIGTE